MDYYAAVEVSTLDEVPSKMQAKTLSAGKYAVFTFRGNSQNSLQPVVDYIYKVWSLNPAVNLTNKQNTILHATVK
ncbi:MAG TPA: hypothetical protein DDZ99_03890 [Clostridiales bacterium]|nr:hypothetical protein [Clostridiales bacterium]